MLFDNVKSITIPDGIVTKIATLAGTILWQTSSAILEWFGYPIVCNGSMDGEFEDVRIYGNSKQAALPNPQTPVEVESVGDKTKNLFDKNNVNWIGVKGVYSYMESSTGRFRIVESTIYPIQRTFYLPCKPNTTYTLTKNLSSVMRAGAFDTVPVDGSIPNVYTGAVGKKITLTTDSESKYIVIQLYTNPDYPNVNWDLLKDNIQVEEGSETTSYEPYGYKIPVKVSGKNLFDYNKLTNGYYNDNGIFTDSVNAVKTDFIAIYGNTNYTFSGNLSRAGGYTRIHAFDKNKQWISMLAKRPEVDQLKFNITTPSQCSYIVMSGYLSSRDAENIQLEQGSEATPYEPYIEPTTTNIYLDEPLRKVDTHTDVIDSKTNKLTRNIKELKFTGYEDWFTSSSSGKHYYSIPKSSLGTDLPHGSDDILCTHFKTHAGDIGNLPVGQVCVGNNNINFNFDGVNNDIVSFENWLSQNDVKLYYPTILPTEQTIEISPLVGFEGYTKITTDTEIKPSDGYASQII